VDGSSAVTVQCDTCTERKQCETISADSTGGDGADSGFGALIAYDNSKCGSDQQKTIIIAAAAGSAALVGLVLLVLVLVAAGVVVGHFVKLHRRADRVSNLRGTGSARSRSDSPARGVQRKNSSLHIRSASGNSQGLNEAF
jgi:hypothetical protein